MEFRCFLTMAFALACTMAAAQHTLYVADSSRGAIHSVPLSSGGGSPTILSGAVVLEAKFGAVVDTDTILYRGTESADVMEWRRSTNTRTAVHTVESGWWLAALEVPPGSESVLLLEAQPQWPYRSRLLRGTRSSAESSFAFAPVGPEFEG